MRTICSSWMKSMRNSSATAEAPRIEPGAALASRLLLSLPRSFVHMNTFKICGNRNRALLALKLAPPGGGGG